MLIWQDLVAFVAAVGGAFQSSRKIPGFPDDSKLAKFSLGLHITVFVAIFSCMASPSVSLDNEVTWVRNLFDFPMPLIGYALIISLGMALILNTIFQTVLIKVKEKQNLLVTFALIMIDETLSILPFTSFSVPWSRACEAQSTHPVRIRCPALSQGISP